MERSSSPMMDGGDSRGRLDDIERRLRARAEAPAPSGLTQPDTDSGERWEAGHVWAHLAEFVGYWQAQIESVIAAFDGNAVPFGRTKRDAGRIAAIEMGRHEPVAELVERTTRSITQLKHYLAGLGSAEWNAVGRHETLGEMDVEAIVERFLIDHLEEHLDQLDRLDA